MPRRGENIYHRKIDNRWEGRYRPPGWTKYIYVYGHTCAEVREKLQKVKAQHLKQVFPRRAMSVSELVTEWLACKEGQIKVTSLEQYQKLSRLYIVPYLGAMQVSDLTAQKITEYISVLQRSEGRRRGLSAGTIHSVMALLKMLLKYAQKMYGFLIDLSDVILPKKERGEVIVYSADEMAKISQFAEEHLSDTNCGIFLACNTGIRVGEDCGLKWGDVDFDQCTLTIRRTATRIHQADGKTILQVQPPKTRSSERTIPLPPSVISVLRAQKKSHNDEDHILTGTSRPMDPRTLQNQYRVFLKKAGVRYRNFHVLRHSFATHSAQGGMSVDCLRRILGHSSSTTTMAYYTHTTSDYMREMMGRVCAWHQIQ